MINLKQKFLYSKAVDLKRIQFIEGSLKELVPETTNILDVGCGNGNISLYLGQKGFNVNGIDISEKAILKAKSLNDLTNVTFHQIGAEDLCVVDNSQYDVIICSEVLEHLKYPGALVSTLHSMLKTNGKLIVTVPNGYGPREFIITKPAQWLQKHNMWKSIAKIKKLFGYNGTTVQSDAEDLSHIQFFTKRSLSRLLEKGKFHSVKFGHSDFIADVFPYSFLTKKIKTLQKIDCNIADRIPHIFTSGYNTVWEKD